MQRATGSGQVWLNASSASTWRMKFSLLWSTAWLLPLPWNAKRLLCWVRLALFHTRYCLHQLSWEALKSRCTQPSSQFRINDNKSACKHMAEVSVKSACYSRSGGQVMSENEMQTIMLAEWCWWWNKQTDGELPCQAADEPNRCAVENPAQERDQQAFPEQHVAAFQHNASCILFQQHQYHRS